MDESHRTKKSSQKLKYVDRDVKTIIEELENRVERITSEYRLKTLSEEGIHRMGSNVGCRSLGVSSWQLPIVDIQAR